MFENVVAGDVYAQAARAEHLQQGYDDVWHKVSEINEFVRR
ncbi:hypothetical protein SGLAM104S_01161 [Streptomyces glaucescens]